MAVWTAELIWGLQLGQDGSDQSRLVNSWGSWSRGWSGSYWCSGHSLNFSLSRKRSSPWAGDVLRTISDSSGSHLSVLLVSISISSIGNGDKISIGINIVVLALNILAISRFLMGHIGLLLIISNFVSIVISSIGRQLSVVLKLLLLTQSSSRSNSPM